MNSPLKDRMLQLWGSFHHEGGNPVAYYEDLELRYSEKHRAYHTLAHLEHCFDELDAALTDVNGVSATNRVAVELALWYHDVFYDTHAQNNEERSAILAENVLNQASCYTLAGLVGSYIRITAHTGKPRGLDEKLVVDIDLAILGQSAEKFDEYERQIREEYAWVEDEPFRTGRSTILRRFLDQPTIYHLRYFRDKYEAQARENLHRSLARLAK